MQLVLLVIKYLDNTLSDKVHLLNWRLVTNNCPILLKNAAEHINDELVYKAALTVIEEVVEGSLELLEDLGVLNQVGLHFGGYLLIEGELLDDEIEVVEKSLLDVFADVAVEGRLNVVRLV